jgi:predicted Zn-dependent protease
MDAAEAAVRQALSLAPEDPWIQSLAGRIAFAGGAFPLAVERLRAAIRLRPRFIEAHQQLAQAYTASGRKQEAGQELEQVRILRQRAPNASADDAPPYLSRLFQGSQAR